MRGEEGSGGLSVQAPKQTSSLLDVGTLRRIGMPWVTTN